MSQIWANGRRKSHEKAIPWTALTSERSKIEWQIRMQYFDWFLQTDMTRKRGFHAHHFFRTVYLSSEGSEQFLKQNTFFYILLKASMRSSILKQLKCQLNKWVGCRNPQKQTRKKIYRISGGQTCCNLLSVCSISSVRGLDNQFGNSEPCCLFLVFD
jgi:hypothetical protein